MKGVKIVGGLLVCLFFGFFAAAGIAWLAYTAVNIAEECAR